MVSKEEISIELEKNISGKQQFINSSLKSIKLAKFTFNKYLLSASYGLGTLLGSEERGWRQTKQCIRYLLIKTERLLWIKSFTEEIENMELPQEYHNDINLGFCYDFLKCLIDPDFDGII
ncbi:G-protein coupled receptor family C group 6 member A [Prionailurus iriomotensis]